MLSASICKELKVLREGYARKIAAIDEILDEKPTTRDIGTDPIPRGGRLKAIANAAYSVLIETDGLMRRESILERIETAGVPVTGDGLEKKLRLLSSAMSKDTRLKSMGRGTGLWDIDREHTNRIQKMNGQSPLHVPPASNPVPSTSPTVASGFGEAARRPSGSG